MGSTGDPPTGTSKAEPTEGCPYSLPMHSPFRPASRRTAQASGLCYPKRNFQTRSKGLTLEEIASNEMTLAATLYAITILGEAARRVSQEFREKYPRVPWQQITGIRSVIVHDYQRVDKNEIWNVCARDVPALIPQFEEILKDYPVQP